MKERTVERPSDGSSKRWRTRSGTTYRSSQSNIFQQGIDSRVHTSSGKGSSCYGRLKISSMMLYRVCVEANSSINGDIPYIDFYCGAESHCNMSLNDVLLDPSILVTDKELAATETRFERYVTENHPENELQFHVSESFRDAVTADAEWEDTAVFNFYKVSDQPAEVNQIQEFLDQYDNRINTYTADPYYVNTADEEEVSVSRLLQDEVGYYERFEYTEQLVDVLTDEFVFLNEESIIAGDSDRQVQKFKDIGSVVLDVGRSAFETVVSRSLDINEDDLDEGEEILNKANVTRTFGKFSIIGGSSVAGVIGGPLIAALAPTAGGIILLIDPESDDEF